jgi:hypothetical protein
MAAACAWAADHWEELLTARERYQATRGTGRGHALTTARTNKPR